MTTDNRYGCGLHTDGSVTCWGQGPAITPPAGEVFTTPGSVDGRFVCDGTAGDYFNAKYNMWAMDPSGRFQERMQFKGYRSGHMMYLHAPSMKKYRDDLARFIQETDRL